MYILIDQNGYLSLQDIDNMKEFSIRAKCENVDRSQLLSLAQPVENDHFWIDRSSVIQLSEKAEDPAWLNHFEKMLKMVEPYGYYDSGTTRIKAHFDSLN